MKDADKMETFVFKSLIDGQINPCEASFVALLEKTDVKGNAEKMKDADKMETYVFKSLIDGQINPCEAMKIMKIWQESK